MWRDISAKQLNELKEPLIVDVRSPCEHEKERILGSVNIPLLSDDERAEVGTIYVQQGELVARRYAVKIIAPKIPDIIESIAELKKPGQPLVVHCWRGGLRSETVVSMLSVAGFDCMRLAGGYKAWRKLLLVDFEEGAYRFEPIVLHGLTGVGKTDLLQLLEAAGHAVLDLERLASHRGSVFGGIGLAAQPTQKNFEAMLWNSLRNLGEQPVFLEAESRKVGKLALPDCVFEKISAGRRVLVTGSLEARTRRIVADYARSMDDASKQKALMSLMCLKERLGAAGVDAIRELFTAGRLEEAVKLLLIDYYDPLYMKQIERARPFEFEVCADDPADAVKEIQQWLAANLNYAGETAKSSK
jgi:tRNA 2-selenouridine synthase